MSAPTKSSTVNKFTVCGVLSLLVALSFTVLAFDRSDVEIFTMIALPFIVLSAGLFFRNYLEKRKVK